jgi:hypothetical protein
VLGNIAYEDGNFDPWRVQGGGRNPNPRSTSGGYGLVQWTPGSKLADYIGSAVPNINNEIGALAAQLAGRGPHPEGAAGAALRAARSPWEAAYVFGGKTASGGSLAGGYERYAGAFQPNRAQAAVQYYAKYAGKFDSGGFLPTGLSMALNKTSKPEAILTGTQWEDIHRIATQNASESRDVIAELRKVNNALERLNNLERFNIEHFETTAMPHEPVESKVVRGLHKLMFELGD